MTVKLAISHFNSKSRPILTQHVLDIQNVRNRMVKKYVEFLSKFPSYQKIFQSIAIRLALKNISVVLIHGTLSIKHYPVLKFCKDKYLNFCGLNCSEFRTFTVLLVWIFDGLSNLISYTFVALCFEIPRLKAPL